MANPILENAAKEIGRMNVRIEEAKELIEALTQAGEETGELRSSLTKAELRKNKWENMLHAKGIM